MALKIGSSIEDAIFSLHSITENTLSKKGRLYCAFVYFSKVFDSVNRIYLWYKLSKVGIRGKLLNVIQSLYQNVKSCVTLYGKLTNYFSSYLGLAQGAVMYVNDCEMCFLQTNVDPHYFQELSLLLLMYEYDMVLFSESTLNPSVYCELGRYPM